MKKRNLPPLNALKLFETAAHSSSLSAAAEELGITHGAVSRQIKLLEEWLGQPLFERQGQRSVAAEHARAFAAEISTAFDIISDAATRFGKTPNTRVIRVNAQTTLAMHWLIPRLSAFHIRHPEIEVSVSTSNSSEVKGLSGFDVLIRREPLDRPEWRYFEKRALFEERLTLIAAPKLMTRLPVNKPADLASQVFVTSHTRVGEWEKWMKRAGIESLRPLRSQRFEHNYISLQAVIDGLGVGIGGLPTLGQDVNEKRLMTPLPVDVKGSKYVALIAPDVDKSSSLNLFLEWLEQEAST
ncbi:TPA: LysR substrate-binding domain-containing protein [Citrobacter freundii]|uniref:LysR substrate-binding domain-containing protein n=1 Tax=Citrobacter freundii TaxID=546 RepID=UPI00397C3B85|nr:LysR family transcriptional regulator [Citrobacter freundii]HBM9256188.1 LysR family transcriptional regulator [Citrobacter freundii]HBM9261180.1 LysR family transcriptional regulator [Citrobacter freundii]